MLTILNPSSSALWSLVSLVLQTDRERERERERETSVLQDIQRWSSKPFLATLFCLLQPWLEEKFFCISVQWWCCMSMQVERLTSAGMLLKQLCTTQGEELKALKEAFPALLKEMPELRDTHGKQERESDTAQRVATLLQDEISSLRGKIECFTADLNQVFLPLTTFLSKSASSYLQNQHNTTPQICSSSVCSKCIWKIWHLQWTSFLSGKMRLVGQSSVELVSKVCILSLVFLHCWQLFRVCVLQARAVSSKLAERLDKTERFSCQSGCCLNHSSEADIVPAAAAQPFRWRENKLATMLASDGKLTQQLRMTAIPEQAALREWCGNSLQESASSNGGPLVDAFKIRVASILRTASQGSQN